MKQVLLVEDHALFRESLALLLRLRLGMHSVEAGSLAEGRKVLSDLEDAAELAIIDLELPDGDGSELIEQLHESSPEVPILAFATDRSPLRRARALEAGAEEVLARETTVERIIDAVKQFRPH